MYHSKLLPLVRNALFVMLHPACNNPHLPNQLLLRAYREALARERELLRGEGAGAGVFFPDADSEVEGQEAPVGAESEEEVVDNEVEGLCEVMCCVHGIPRGSVPAEHRRGAPPAVPSPHAGAILDPGSGGGGVGGRYKRQVLAAGGEMKGAERVLELRAEFVHAITAKSANGRVVH